MGEISSNLCVKFAFQIQFWVATKTILSSKLWCEPNYFGYWNEFRQKNLKVKSLCDPNWDRPENKVSMCFVLYFIGTYLLMA